MLAGLAWMLRSLFKARCPFCERRALREGRTYREVFEEMHLSHPDDCRG